MIESLAEHGVDPMDLVPSLMTTHTIKNPEYDPEEVKREALAEEMERVRIEEEDEREQEDKEKVGESEIPDEDGSEHPPPPYTKMEVNIPAKALPTLNAVRSPLASPLAPRKFNNPFGDDEDEDEVPHDVEAIAGPSTGRIRSTSSATRHPPSSEIQEEEGDGDLAMFSEDSEYDEISAAQRSAAEDDEESTTPKANPPQPLPGVPEGILSPRLITTA